jgi:hypothetical protein
VELTNRTRWSVATAHVAKASLLWLRCSNNASAVILVYGEQGRGTAKTHELLSLVARELRTIEVLSKAAEQQAANLWLVAARDEASCKRIEAEPTVLDGIDRPLKGR